MKIHNTRRDLALKAERRQEWQNVEMPPAVSLAATSYQDFQNITMIG
jgi:hypothetical protein